MVVSITKQLNGGWECQTDRELDKCQFCKVDIKQGDKLYYCEQNDRFYCYDCIMKHHAMKNHTDWHIVKLIPTKK